MVIIGMNKILICPSCKMETIRVRKKYRFPLWDCLCSNCSFGIASKAPTQEAINNQWKEELAKDVWYCED